MTYAQALQDTLAAEHAALYVYGVLAGRTSRSSTPGLFASLDEAHVAHRTRRDHLVAVLADQDVTGVAAEPAYETPAGLGSADAVTDEALRLERACARTYAWLVESSPSDARRWALEALNETAVRELVFRGAPEMLPGSDEYADR